MPGRREPDLREAAQMALGGQISRADYYRLWQAVMEERMKAAGASRPVPTFELDTRQLKTRLDDIFSGITPCLGEQAQQQDLASPPCAADPDTFRSHQHYHRRTAHGWACDACEDYFPPSPDI